MVFWMFSYKELTSHAGSNSVGMFVLFAQFVHIAIMGDFFYYYAIRSDNRQTDMVAAGFELRVDLFFVFFFAPSPRKLVPSIVSLLVEA